MMRHVECVILALLLTARASASDVASMSEIEALASGTSCNAYHWSSDTCLVFADGTDLTVTADIALTDMIQVSKGKSLTMSGSTGSERLNMTDGPYYYTFIVFGELILSKLTLFNAYTSNGAVAIMGGTGVFSECIFFQNENTN